MLTAFVASLLLITLFELGDKSFFVAMFLAMRHSRRLVFTGVLGALIAMTIASVLIGQVISYFPKRYIVYAEVALFIGFGLKLLYDAYRISPTATKDEISEAKEAIAESELAWSKTINGGGVILQAFSLTFITEWGDRTQFATIALAASNNPVGVTVGGILGHAICTAIAVIGGRLIAGRVSERLVTAIGGGLFIFFGIVAAIESHTS
ncbi:TMEM165/GDT1 family protein [Leptodesmis sichuanensis]|uniref:TMEM165/GDT1 family protein n=1 Tax=Leptodesmis sichuanensis TaxID=2906798 RepID=UPI001F23751D|nr:TMEM165/GDT1 family protein [Leptodesmis sichuanensis]UIE38630.1 TMEM165/GDT1 family protein [Leptodesmis sichuanensis A121]